MSKKWEKFSTTSNGKAKRLDVHVHEGDTVQVVTGADKGKVTKVVDVNRKNGMVLCEGVNVITRHLKPQRQGDSGQIVRMEAPIHSSNIMAYSIAQGVRSRVGLKVEGGKKIRFLKKTGESLGGTWERKSKVVDSNVSDNNEDEQ